MAVREIIRMGHPTLRQSAAPYPVDSIGSSEFEQLVADMRETLHAYSGIGLAAPQIDVPYQIAIIEMEGGASRYGTIDALPFAVYVNPVITVLDEEDTAGYWEGCLSVPGLRGFVTRPQHIAVDYLNETGATCRLEASGFHATVFQHEFDHLLGTLFIDRISDTTRVAFDEEYQQFHMND